MNGELKAYEFQNDFDKAIEFYSQSLKTRINSMTSLEWPILTVI